MDEPEILIVEDDSDIAELLAITFAREGWKSSIAGSGEDALALLKASRFSACVLDIMLPGIEGLAVLRKIRKNPGLADLPVIIASARGEEIDIVSGLELGADDYVAKPFSPKVLAARIRAILRRRTVQDDSISASESDEPVPGESGERIERFGISLDKGRHEVRVEGAEVLLSATEFSLLAILMSDPGRVFTRSQAIESIRGHDYPVTDRSIDVQIMGLRRKLGSAGSRIETVRGVGYRFRDASRSGSAEVTS